MNMILILLHPFLIQNSQIHANLEVSIYQVLLHEGIYSKLFCDVNDVRNIMYV